MVVVSLNLNAVAKETISYCTCILFTYVALVEIYDLMRKLENFTIVHKFLLQ